MTKITTGVRIVEKADILFYQQGFEHTSFAQIAAVVRISRGNFYYHFKTKDELLDAVIRLRLSNTQQMLDDWEAEGNETIDRIRCFVRILVSNQRDIQHFGCPVGTLTAELSKLNHPLEKHANKVFTLFHGWLKHQFLSLGRDDADQLAMHLIALSQGVATLANAFKDEKFIRNEEKRINEWLDEFA
ncbi:MAG: TetR/AcrR family transcriptional regulator [Kangiellaceae bacterium]|nr:TetR/AcrR family transcriptional regulator [Kangiellaceae bacterium]